MRSGLRGGSVVIGCVLLSVVSCGRNPSAPTTTPDASTHGAAMSQVSEQPFVGRATGQASFDLANPRGCAAGFTTVTDAKGTATHLGLMTLHSEHCVTPTGGMEGSMVFTAANGDEVHATYSGGSTPPGPIGEPVHATATVVIAGGTGRFAKASGQADLTAAIIFEGFDKPTWPGQWAWKGTISF